MPLKPPPLLHRPIAPGHRTRVSRGQAPAVGPDALSLAGDPARMNGTGGFRPASLRLHRKQASAYLGVSLSWLDKSRLRGDGPAYLQVGGRVVYDQDDLDLFLARCRRRSTSDEP